jgi:hypothetical protein
VTEPYDRIERSTHDRSRSQIGAVLKVFQIAFGRAIDPFPVGANLCRYFSKTTISHLSILKKRALMAGFWSRNFSNFQLKPHRPELRLKMTQWRFRRSESQPVIRMRIIQIHYR